jgi:hypothetical protein
LGAANVVGASFERGNPQFFVRNAVRTHDWKRRKIAPQVAHIAQTGLLHIKDYSLRPAPGDALAKLFAGASEMDRMEARRESFGDSGIAFDYDYVEAHRSSSKKSQTADSGCGEEYGYTYSTDISNETST